MRVEAPFFSFTQSSTTSRDTPTRLAPLLDSITASESIVSLAFRVRYKGEGPDKDNGCSLIQPPKYGSFNLLYTVEFADGGQWLVCIPGRGGKGHFTPK